jgi:hypothetical protein
MRMREVNPCFCEMTLSSDHDNRSWRCEAYDADSYSAAHGHVPLFALTTNQWIKALLSVGGFYFAKKPAICGLSCVCGSRVVESYPSKM